MQHQAPLHVIWHRRTWYKEILPIVKAMWLECDVATHDLGDGRSAAYHFPNQTGLHLRLDIDRLIILCKHPPHIQREIKCARVPLGITYRESYRSHPDIGVATGRP